MCLISDTYVLLFICLSFQPFIIDFYLFFQAMVCMVEVMEVMVVMVDMEWV